MALEGQGVTVAGSAPRTMRGPATCGSAALSTPDDEPPAAGLVTARRVRRANRAATGRRWWISSRASAPPRAASVGEALMTHVERRDRT